MRRGPGGRELGESADTGTTHDVEVVHFSFLEVAVAAAGVVEGVEGVPPVVGEMPVIRLAEETPHLLVFFLEAGVLLLELADLDEGGREGGDLVWGEAECGLELGDGLLELRRRGCETRGGRVWTRSFKCLRDDAPARCRPCALRDGELVLLHYGCALGDQAAVTRRIQQRHEPSRTCTLSRNLEGEEESGLKTKKKRRRVIIVGVAHCRAETLVLPRIPNCSPCQISRQSTLVAPSHSSAHRISPPHAPRPPPRARAARCQRPSPSSSSSAAPRQFAVVTRPAVPEGCVSVDPRSAKQSLSGLAPLSHFASFRSDSAISASLRPPSPLACFAVRPLSLSPYRPPRTPRHHRCTHHGRSTARMPPTSEQPWAFAAILSASYLHFENHLPPSFSRHLPGQAAHSHASGCAPRLIAMDPALIGLPPAPSLYVIPPSTPVYL